MKKRTFNGIEKTLIIVLGFVAFGTLMFSGILILLLASM